MLRTLMIKFWLTLLVLQMYNNSYDYDENASCVLVILGVVVLARHESRFLTMIQKSNREMDRGVQHRT